MAYSLDRLKEYLEKNAGETGIKIYQTSLAKFKISENPSADELTKITKEIERNLIIFFGKTRTKEIFAILEREVGEQEYIFESELKLALENIYKTKGIPGESDLIEISRYLVSKGYKMDGNKALEMLKQSSKKKVVIAMNESIIHYEIQRFLDKYPFYSKNDIGNFISYLKDKKLDVKEGSINDAIEKERLYRKFEDRSQEDTWQEKIARQFAGLFGSAENGDYKYLMVDGELAAQLMKKISK